MWQILTIVHLCSCLEAKLTFTKYCFGLVFIIIAHCLSHVTHYKLLHSVFLKLHHYFFIPDSSIIIIIIVLLLLLLGWIIFSCYFSRFLLLLCYKLNCTMTTPRLGLVILPFQKREFASQLSNSFLYLTVCLLFGKVKVKGLFINGRGLSILSQQEQSHHSNGFSHSTFIEESN